MACVGIPEKVPDGGAAVMPMDQPQPIGAAAGTAQQSVHRDAGLIGIFAVEIGGDDAALRDGFQTRASFAETGYGYYTQQRKLWQEANDEARNREKTAVSSIFSKIWQKRRCFRFKPVKY